MTQNHHLTTNAHDYYSESYSHFGIHEEMLKDKIRTFSYRNAIYRNRSFFQDKTVLDIGCGTGILSMFAASAGAKLVIGVDMSDMIDHAKKIIHINNFSDRIILLKGKMEEVVLPVEEVDIIISEWMGYFLLYESMLDTVIWARDRYLKKGGLMFPNKAVINLAALEDSEYKNEKIHFWDDVYGFDMSVIKSFALSEPLVDYVDSNNIVSINQIILDIDLTTVQKKELSFTKHFSLRITKPGPVHALVTWFSVFFPSLNTRCTGLSTSPYDKQTHWKQTIFYLPTDLDDLKINDTLTGTLVCSPNLENPRALDINIEYGLSSQNLYSYLYKMA